MKYKIELRFRIVCNDRRITIAKPGLAKGVNHNPSYLNLLFFSAELTFLSNLWKCSVKFTKFSLTWFNYVIDINLNEFYKLKAFFRGIRVINLFSLSLKYSGQLCETNLDLKDIACLSKYPAWINLAFNFHLKFLVADIGNWYTEYLKIIYSLDSLNLVNSMSGGFRMSF